MGWAATRNPRQPRLSAMYTIKRAAEHIGVSAATLRAWERRYGVVTPTRSDGGYRVYDEDDVRTLRDMAGLVADGWTPSLAAQEALRRTGPRTTAEPLGGEPVVSAADVDDLIEELIAGAAELSAARVATALDGILALGSYEVIVDRYLLPAMQAVGDGWASGRISVAGEHLTANAVMRRLAAAYEAASPYGGPNAVVVGLPPDAHHEIGVLAFAVAARRRGLSIDYLGADLPAEEWADAVRERNAIAAVLAIPTEQDVPAAKRVIAAVRAENPDVLIAVGGRQQESAPEEAVRLGHQVAAAAHTLAGLLSD